MQEKHLFEYAVIRVVPMVEREEFLNVGIILYSQQTKFLECIYSLDKERLRAFNNTVDMVEVEKHLQSFERICKGDKESGPIGLIDTASRFRWLTATRSTVVQASRVHPGLSPDPQETLDELHRTMVL